jgi:tetratricopeptide (TPR) repeat protein
MTPWILALCLAAPTGAGGGCHVDGDVVDRLIAERVTGSLATAESGARRLLQCPGLPAAHRLEIELELAKILDRIGLHQNTRPVAEALEILRAAEALLAAEDTDGRARISLALAEYFYRAEMSEREFASASAYAQRAERLFTELEDPVGEADAVHRLGLIALQQGRLGDARELFDRSLELSRQGPVRPIFLSDYHRHIGFVDMSEDDVPSAISHFERSLAYRDEAGSRDYGLFARTMLGSALIRGGRPGEAGPHLERAYEVARDLPSPVGQLRAAFNLARMHEALATHSEALRWYRRVDELATGLGVEDIRQSARAGQQRALAMIAAERAER